LNTTEEPWGIYNYLTSDCQWRGREAGENAEGRDGRENSVFARREGGCPALSCLAPELNYVCFDETVVGVMGTQSGS